MAGPLRPLPPRAYWPLKFWNVGKKGSKKVFFSLMAGLLTPAHFICTGSLCLVILSYLRCCNTNLETAILNMNILDNKNIHQAPLVSTQLAVALTIMGRATASCFRLTQ